MVCGRGFDGNAVWRLAGSVFCQTDQQGDTKWVTHVTGSVSSKTGIIQSTWFRNKLVCHQV